VSTGEFFVKKLLIMKWVKKNLLNFNVGMYDAIPFPKNLEEWIVELPHRPQVHGPGFMNVTRDVGLRTSD